MGSIWDLYGSIWDWDLYGDLIYMGLIWIYMGFGFIWDVYGIKQSIYMYILCMFEVI